tara:strand:- start:2001 stop:2780 length:780 start_codon:yes stop_codon:yes gene_type:complete
MRFDYMKSNEKITALIAARMGSSRFPGKTLEDLHGMPMLSQLIERIKASNYVNDLVVATTDLNQDNDIEEWCKQNEIGCYRGSADDVLGRLTSAAKHFNCSTVVEVLGDNPLVHCELIDSCLIKYFSGDYDYVATLTDEYPKVDISLKRFPIGVRVQVMSLETLKKCSKLTSEERHREHATSFIAENPKIFKTSFIEAKGKFELCNRPELTFAVNEKKNLNLVREIFSMCYKDNKNFNLNDIITAFDNNPHLKVDMGNS